MQKISLFHDSSKSRRMAGYHTVAMVMKSTCLLATGQADHNNLRLTISFVLPLATSLLFIHITKAAVCLGPLVNFARA